MTAFVLISALILLTCVLIVLIVLVQNSKGGGLASNFQSSNQFMGVRKTTDFLEKSTWTLAVVLLVLSLLTVFVIPRQNVAEGQLTETEQYMQENPEAQPVDFQTPIEETPTP